MLHYLCYQSLWNLQNSKTQFTINSLSILHPEIHHQHQLISGSARLESPISNLSPDIKAIPTSTRTSFKPFQYLTLPYFYYIRSKIEHPGTFPFKSTQYPLINISMILPLLVLLWTSAACAQIQLSYDPSLLNANLIRGKDNLVSGRGIITDGTNNTVKGYSVTAEGENNHIIALDSQVFGKSNVLKGKQTYVNGNRNNVNADETIIQGETNSISGGNHKILGDQNQVEGSANLVFGSQNLITNENDLKFDMNSRAQQLFSRLFL